MHSIKRISGGRYYAVELEGREDWVFDPATGKESPYGAGLSPNAVAWFYTPETGFVFYDAVRREPTGRLQMPAATDQDGKDTHSHFQHRILQSADGRFAYLILYHSIRSIDLHIVDTEQQSVQRSLTGLPGGSGVRRGNALVDADGRILISVSVGGAGTATPGLVRVDPATGSVEESACAGSPVRRWLHSPSPCGRYWLRVDDSRLPVLSERGPGKKLFGAGARQQKDHFSFAIEIWEAFPLRRLHSLAPMWMTAEELPDNGSQDAETRKQGLPALRGKIYRNVARVLDQDEALTMRDLHKDSYPELWPDPDKFYQNITKNLNDLAFSDNDMIGWQPDRQAFWIQRHGFVTCVGVDGSVSPKIMLERYGYRRGTWLPCAASWQHATPLPDRQLDLRYGNEMVTVSGAGEPATPRIRVVPIAEDRLRPWQPSREDARDEELAKKAEATADRNSVYDVDLSSLDERDCIAAIEGLAARIGPDINHRPHDNQLRAVFRLDRRQLTEKDFFTHVAGSCPNAGSAVKRLIGLASAHLKPHATAYYEPEGDEEGLVIGVFGYAAWCLACLDSSSNDTLIRYGRLIDTHHENFYLLKIFPQMLENTPEPDARLALCEHFFFSDLGNFFDWHSFWSFTGMSDTAASRMSARDYAARLMALARQQEDSLRSQSEFGFRCFDVLAGNWARGASPFERALLDELRILAADPTPADDTASPRPWG